MDTRKKVFGKSISTLRYIIIKIYMNNSIAKKISTDLAVFILTENVRNEKVSLIRLLTCTTPLGMIEYVNMRPLTNAVLQQRIMFVVNHILTQIVIF